jgi:hypothetical protein
LQLSQACSIDYAEAKNALIAKGWNYAAAFSEYKERERRDELVLKFISVFPDLDLD